jgi:hypothetical protein
MYALIILRHRKPPQLLTIFKNRNEFIAAVGRKKSAEPWLEATKAFRAVYEVSDESEFVNSLQTIRVEHPDAYDACHVLLRKFQIPNGLAQ